MFFPTQIIFAATDSCNLHCPHCFVSRNPQKLNTQQAIKFIESCINYSKNTEPSEQRGNIEKIGFTGGEPFLYMDFMEEIIRFTVASDLMFDQIMTNGDWWKTESELTEKLQKLYNAGYDGKIGLSWDTFHGQSTDRIETFIQTVQTIFGPDSLTIQIVQGGENLLNAPFTIPDYLDNNHPEIPYYLLPQTFQALDERAWKSRKWFKDDYCEGPGQILFIHPDGNIAPCCGFANENPQLFIGTIDNSFEEVLKKAGSSRMIDICYNTGLKKYIKVLKKSKIKLPGKTSDICTFCDFTCRHI